MSTNGNWLDDLHSKPTGSASKEKGVAEDGGISPDEEQSRRIAELRARLDQYNTAIANAMDQLPPGMTAGSSSTNATSAAAMGGAGGTGAEESRNVPLQPPSMAASAVEASLSPAARRKLFSPSRDDFNNRSRSRSGTNNTETLLSVTEEEYDDDEEDEEEETETETETETSAVSRSSDADRSVDVVEVSASEPSSTQEVASSSLPQQEMKSSASGLSLEQLENAKFTMDLLNETLASLAERHAEIRRRNFDTRFTQIEDATKTTQALLEDYEKHRQEFEVEMPQSTLAYEQRESVNLEKFQNSLQDFYRQCDQVKTHFEPIYEVQKRHQELSKRIQRIGDELQHRHRRIEIEQKQLRDLETAVLGRERGLRRDMLDLVRQEADFETDGAPIEGRLAKLEERENRVAHWLRILEKRDQETAEKEASLRELDAKIRSELHAEKENLRRRADFLKAASESIPGGSAGTRPKAQQSSERAAPFSSRSSTAVHSQQHQQPQSRHHDPHHQSIIRDDDSEEEDDEEDDYYGNESAFDTSDDDDVKIDLAYAAPSSGTGKASASVGGIFSKLRADERARAYYTNIDISNIEQVDHEESAYF